MNCIFCKIINRELPSSIVYEDDLTLAFLDIHPINEGHILVIPKQHQEKFTQLDPKTVGHLFLVGQKILSAVEKSDINCEGANLILSDGAVAGQEVMHSHMHIIPRFKGDGQRIGFTHSDTEQFPRMRLDEIAKSILKFVKQD